MRSVKAPDGFDGCVYYVDGARSWQPAWRRSGATFWEKKAPLVGHGQTPAAEVDALAEAEIARAVAIWCQAGS